METSNMQGKMKGFGEAIKKTDFPWKTVLFILITGFIAVGGLFGLMEINEAGYITVKQSLLTGKVTIVSKPGIFCQCFGTITKYREAGTFKFAQTEKAAGGKEKARPRKNRESDPEMAEEIEVRFNDGSIGWISGMAFFDLPKDEEKLGLLHMKFRSFRNLLETGIIPTIKESVVLTAALMSSGESYTTKRAIFSEWSRDQIEKGTYMTEEMIKEEKDQRTGDVTKKISVKIKTDNNRLLRNENPLERYSIKFKQFQVTEIRYETETENLIKTKMEALQKTIAAKIAAERAIQERLAAEELGKKNVTVAEYEAMIRKKKSEVEAEEAKAVAVIEAQKKVEVGKLEREKETNIATRKVEIEKLEKTRAVIEAQKALDVAKIMAQSAESKKRADILEGEGLAEKKRLIYKADGALQQKLDAYVNVMTVLAKELGKQKWVPDITMNSGPHGAADGNAAMGFMNLWMMKTAKELGVEMVKEKKNQ